MKSFIKKHKFFCIYTIFYTIFYIFMFTFFEISWKPQNNFFLRDFLIFLFIITAILYAIIFLLDFYILDKEDGNENKKNLWQLLRESSDKNSKEGATTDSEE